jgi:YD repeat-containing protein
MFEVARNRTENINGDWEEYKCHEDKNQNKFKEYANSSGYWWKSSLNINNDLLLYENSDGVWEQSTYDEKGQLLSYQDSTGLDIKCYYHENGQYSSMNISETKPGFGFFTKEQIDSGEQIPLSKVIKAGNTTRTENSDGSWEESIYDEDGNEISYKTSDMLIESK